MNICLVSQEYPPETGGGGIGTQTFLKAQGLSARGHEVHVVSTSWDEQARMYRDGAVMIHRIAEPKLAVEGYEPSTSWLAYSMAVAEKLHALGKETKFDVIQFAEYGGEGFIFQTDTFAHRQAKYVVQLHGPLSMFSETMGWPEPGTFLEIGMFMERTVMRHTDRLMASSRYVAKFCGREDAAVVHSGVDTRMFSPRPRPADERMPRILFVGTIVGNKGVGLLVEAVLRLRAKFPKICLRIVGKGEAELQDKLRAQIAGAGATAHFEFTGPVMHDQLTEHYAWCDCFAAPSTIETLGNTYLEAMACGRAPIACNTGGTPEVVLDGETGLLIAPRDVNALEEAILKLSADAGLRERLANRGRQWVEENFSLPKYIAKIEAVFRQ